MADEILTPWMTTAEAATYCARERGLVVATRRGADRRLVFRREDLAAVRCARARGGLGSTLRTTINAVAP